MLIQCLSPKEIYNLDKPALTLIKLMNQLNNFTDDKKENELKLSNCKYREIRLFPKAFQKLLKEDLVPFSHECVYLFIFYLIRYLQLIKRIVLRLIYID